jgi:CHAT domain-containing protein
LRVKLIEYFATNGKVSGFLFSKESDEPRLFKPCLSQDDIRRKTKTFLDFIDITPAKSPSKNIDADSAWHQFTEGWGSLLLEEVADDVKKAEILYLIPHDALHRLPLHAIKVDGKYLCDIVPVCYAPNTMILYRSKLQNGARSCGYKPQTCLSLGCNSDAANPNMNTQYCQFARDMASLFPNKSTTLTARCPELALGEEEANVENLEMKCSKSGFDLISLFCHGRFDPHDPWNSLLLIPPNGLTANDIIHKLRIRSNLVTLTACTSAKPAVWDGDEVHSLSTAIILAGAAAVTGALWNAWVPAAQVFFKNFIEFWKSGDPKAVAFQKAQKQLISGEKFSHPYYWAPYILIGDWV